MSEDKNKGPILPISGLVILLAALGLTFSPQNPFKGSRPPVAEVREPYEKVRARLWQDPFRAVVDHVKALGLSQPARNAGRLGIACAQHDNMTTEDSLLNEIRKRTAAGTKVIILGVMVLGGPYADDAESRTRMRYAALSGLRRLKFEPEDPDHIDFISITKKAMSETISLSNIMPFEWLTHADKKTKTSVLLLWINDEVFQKAPLSRLARLICCLGLSKELSSREVKFKLIGPAGSTTLQEMLKEAEKDPYYIYFVHEPDLSCKSAGFLATALIGLHFPTLLQFDFIPSPSGLEIYSACATVDELLLLRSIDPGIQVNKNFELIERIKTRFGRHGISYERTISTDTQLADLLVKELGLRGLDLKAGHHLLLVAEWDTFYGRSLPGTMENALQKSLQIQLKQRYDSQPRVAEDASRMLDVTEEATLLQDLSKEVSRQLKDRLHRISYLRGIDGNLPGKKEEKKDSQADQKTKSADEIRKLEQPTGESQYDYLRRLAEETYFLDRSLEGEEAGIKAIGILGSDFYDKYLALQALRPWFPQAVFFTTDLDARLLHPDHIEWTRNLVVASGFDLSLRKDPCNDIDLQGEVPPFRDSYQTAVFFSILRAFRDTDCGLGPQEREAIVRPVPPDPLIFEIGRTRAHNLTDLKAGKVGVQRGWQQTIRLSTLLIAMPGTLILLVLLCLTSVTVWEIIKTVFSFFPSKVRKPPVAFGLLFFLGLALCTAFYWFIIHNPNEEIFSLFEGISIWPTELLRAIAFFLALGFFWKSCMALKTNRKEMEDEFCLRRESNPKASETPEGNGGRKDSTLSVLRGIKQEIIKHFRDKRVGDGLKAFWGFAKYDWRIQDQIDMKKLWAEYLRRDSLAYRSLRLTPILSLYLVLCYLILRTTGFPVNPLRGAVSKGINDFILALSVAALVLLIFYVFDVTRVCRQFIVNASERKPEWPTTCCRKLAEKIEDKEALGEWMLVHLVARRTDAVGKLIFYPFIIWSVIILSRIHYFDNWYTPVGLATVITLGAMYAWSSAFVLRKSAENLRQASVHRLKEESVRLLWMESRNEAWEKQTAFALDEIRAIREGAFAPFSQHPLLQCLIVPFGGVGGMFLIDLLAKMNV